MTIISDILTQAQIDELKALRSTALAGDQTAAGTWDYGITVTLH